VPPVIVEDFVPRLDFESCRDAWFLEKLIEFRKDRFEAFKAHLSKQTVSKIRLLKVTVTQRMVSHRSQCQHSVMVRERAKHLHGVRDEGADHYIGAHDATTNVTARGTANDVHHDINSHISTACGRSGASCEQPMELYLLWHASNSRRLATCYFDTAVALHHPRPCRYLIQYSGESLILPANVPHAALSSSIRHLYGQTFHVEGRSRDRTTLELELSALVKPSEAIVTILTCYEEGLKGPGPGVRAVHVSHIVRTISSEKAGPRQARTELYVSKAVKVLSRNRKYNGMCAITPRMTSIVGACTTSRTDP
jgi:hypothetical protein